jgi:hypothetical protein
MHPTFPCIDSGHVFADKQIDCIHKSQAVLLCSFHHENIAETLH